jgi:radical SAM superfamily enzyme YgiQ (UPF0313 family)
MKEISSKIVIIHDPNFSSNIDYKKRLLIELKNCHKTLLAAGTISALGNDDEFLRLAKEAGLLNWFIGFESVSQESLDEVHKHQNRVTHFAPAITKIRSFGVSIVGSFMFGFDNDTVDIFDTTFEAIQNWGLDMADFQIVTPFPGTKLYDRLKAEGRILTQDWGRYNLATVVFEPKHMSADELYEGTRTIVKKTFSLSNIVQNFYRSLEASKNFSVAYNALYRNLWSRQRYKYLYHF